MIPTHNRDSQQTLPNVDVFAFATNGDSLSFVKSLDMIAYPVNLLRIWVFCEHNIIVPNTQYSSKTTFIKIDMKKAHDYMMNHMLASSSEYAWLIYENYIITDSTLLTDCIRTNKDIIAPLLRRFRNSSDMFSNFWGALDSNGYYARSADYIDILNQTTKSLWNVPYICGNILIKKNVIIRNPTLFDIDTIDTNLNLNLDLDMLFCHNLRNAKEEMFVSNMNVYGSIVDDELADMCVTLSDKTTWRPKDYLHPDFYNFMYGSDSAPDPRKTRKTKKSKLSKSSKSSKSFKSIKSSKQNDSTKLVEQTDSTKSSRSSTSIFKELYSDVWQFPIFTETFCVALIAEADRFGKWSAGNDTTYDPRLAGKLEYYPTQDIHLNQLNLHNFWLDTVVSKFFYKVMSHLYKYKAKGYNIAFIARYKFGEQIKLSPHHDASVYTTNISLNACEVDYKGGGCRFVFKDQTVTHNPVGYATLHPGKLSHYHEGLPITEGTRYILVSFNE